MRIAIKLPDDKLILAYEQQTVKNCSELARLFNVNKSYLWFKANRLGLKFTSRFGRFDGKYPKFKIPLDKCESWAFGLLFTDGCLCHKARGSKEINLCSKDEDAIDKVQSIIPVFNKNLCSDTRYWSLTCNNKELWNKLLGLGLFPRKSLDLRPPNVDFIQSSHFIRGCWDGDGWVSRTRFNKLRGGFCTASPWIMKFIIQNIHFTVGRIPKVQVRDRNTGNFLYEIQLCGDNIIKWLNWIYSESTDSIRMDRKYKIYKTIME